MNDEMTAAYDTASADIDGDGTVEKCVLEYGRTSGLSALSFQQAAMAN